MRRTEEREASQSRGIFPTFFVSVVTGLSRLYVAVNCNAVLPVDKLDFVPSMTHLTLEEAIAR